MSDITIVSTTDSPEQVQAALTGKPAADPAPATPSAETPAAATPADADAEPATPPAAPDADAAPATPPASETPEQKAEREAQEQLTATRANRREKRKQSIQEEINELVARRGSVRRDVEAEEARIAELRAKREALENGTTPAAAAPPATPPATAPATPPAAGTPVFDKPQPKIDDKNEDGSAKYPNYDDWVIGLTNWSNERAEFIAEHKATEKLTAKERADRARIEHETAVRAQSETLATYQSKLAEFRKATPTFDADYQDAAEDIEAIQQELGPNSLDVIDLYTTRDADNGPAMVHYLVTHPDEMKRIAALPAPLQLAALGKLDGRFDDASPTARRPVAPPVTRAPEPIKPLGSSPTPAVTPDPDNETYEEYKARRNREELAAAGLR